MAWSPVSGSNIQYQKSDGTLASGYYIKFYNTSNVAISMASTSSGSGLLAKAQLDSSGYPLNGSSARFIPTINQEYKIALYVNETDADNNTFANADWFLGPYEQPSGTGISGGTTGTITTLKAVTGQSDGESLFVLGHTTEGDGGGGHFRWDADDTTADDDGIYIIPDSGGTGRWIRVFGNEVYLKWWGVGAGGDDTAKIDSIIDTYNTICANDGTYNITSSLTRTGDDFRLYGENRNKALFSFNMTDATSCLKIDNGASTVTECNVSGISFTGGNIATGAAVELSDVSFVNFEDIVIENLSTASTSRGFWIKGRQLMTFDRIRMTGVRIGFELGDNPNAATIDSDLYTFRDIFVNCQDEVNGYGWLVTGTNNFHITIEGNSSVNRSLYGFRLSNSSVSGDSSGVTIKNLRIEQGTIANGGYGVDINQDPGADVQNVTLENVRVSTGQNGFRFRNVRYLSMTNCQSSAGSGEVSFNSDSTVDFIHLVNFNRSSSSTFDTNSAPGLVINGALGIIEVYDQTKPTLGGTGATDGVGVVHPFLFSQMNNGPSPAINQMVQYTASQVVSSTALMSVTPPSGVQGFGIVQAADTTGGNRASAIFSFDDTPANAETVLLAQNNASNTAGTGASLNIYGSSNIIRFENQLGASTVISVVIWYSNSALS